MSEVGHSCLDARNAREVSRMRQKNVDIERKEGELAEDCAKMTVTALIDRLTEEIPKKYTTKIAVIEAQHIYKRLSTK